MPEDFLVARNPDAASSLPYLIRLPLGSGVVLKAREVWPRTAKVYCHRAEQWPEEAEVLERVPTRSCVRRGAAVDLVLDRGRENRSQIVFTYVRGREAIFWQSARTTKQARPAVRVPTALAAGTHDPLRVLVDSHERYPYRFAKQQVTVERRALPAGDYAVELDGDVVAAVERKSLQDLVAGLTSGTLRFQLTELASLHRAAVVVEDRYSALLGQRWVRAATAADALAELQVRWPTVPVVFTETRPLAEEWTYRWLAAARHEAQADRAGAQRLQDLAVRPRGGAAATSVADSEPET